jgi:hypothetical protein
LIMQMISKAEATAVFQIAGATGIVILGRM